MIAAVHPPDMDRTLSLPFVEPLAGDGARDRHATIEGEMNLRYIGSKARIAEGIADIVGDCSNGGAFVDGFCGTGSVAAAVADRGWKIRLNDTLTSAVTTASARLFAYEDVPFRKLGGYSSTLKTLNETIGLKGFFWREYSPASVQHGRNERRYFTEENAVRIDAMRTRIRNWQLDGVLSKHETELLVADLILAVNRVANIAGTYGCFLSKWSAQAKRSLELKPRPLREISIHIESRVGDVKDLSVQSTDVVYLDPPYTKRQYAAYYHILETVAVGDEPVVEGITGLRPWKTLSSPYCYKAKALTALTSLVGQLQASRILLSYSSEGHVPRAALETALSDVGLIEVFELGAIGRYRPNRVAVKNSSSVTEYLISIIPHPNPRNCP